jgi:hypothetical protein
MKRRHRIISIALCIGALSFIPAHAQKPSVDGLHGNVKSIEEHSYKARVRKQQVVNGRSLWEYRGMYDYSTELDSSGRELQTIYRRKNGDTASVRTFTYDSHGAACKLIATSYIKSKWSDSSTYINEYSEDGRLVKRIAPYSWFEPRAEFTYTYDSSEVIIEYVLLPVDTSKTVFESAIYFSNWKIKSKNVYHPNGGLIGYYTYSYDSSWRLTNTFWCNGSGIVLSSLHWKYDENDAILQYEYWDHLRSKHDYHNYKYEFDDHGNWTRCVEYRNGKPVYVKERKISYW